MSKWWPVPAAWLWLCVVYFFAGAPAVFFSGVTGLLICLLAFWEAGSKDPCDPTADDRG